MKFNDSWFGGVNQIFFVENNTVVLNMSKCDGIGSSDYYAGLELFFDGLSQLTKEKDDALWPYDSFDEIFDYDETDVNEKVKTIIKNWEYSRNAYPGWLIPPSDRRKSLFSITEYYQRSIFYHIHKGHLSGKVSSFKKNIWSHVNKDGLPKIPNIYSKKYILDLPAPDNVDVHALIKNYILGLTFPQENKGIVAVSAYNKPLILIELENCSSSYKYPDGITWTNVEFDCIVTKIFEAWKHDISLLSERDKDDLANSDLFGRIVEKYNSVDDVLAQVIISSNILAEENNTVKSLLSEFEQNNILCIQLKLILSGELSSFDCIYDVICGSDLNEIKSACEAVYTAVSLKKVEYSEAVRSLLRKLSLVVRVRRTIGLSSVITLFHNLIYSDLVTDDTEIIDNLLFGLEQLLEETKLSNNTLGCSTNQCLQLRASANMLAYIMYKKFAGNEMITSRLLPWKELSSDLSEFSEVRNRWICS